MLSSRILPLKNYAVNNGPVVVEFDTYRYQYIHIWLYPYLYISIRGPNPRPNPMTQYRFLPTHQI